MSSLTSDDSYMMDTPWQDYSVFSNYSCYRDDSDYDFRYATSDSLYSERAYCCMSPYSYVFDSNDECCARRDRLLSEDDIGCDRTSRHRSSFSFQEASRCTPSLLGRDFDSLSTGCISHLDHGILDDCLNGPDSDLSSSDHECPSSALSLQGFSQVHDDLMLSTGSVCDSVGDACGGYMGDASHGCVGDVSHGCVGDASHGFQAGSSKRYQVNDSKQYQANPSKQYQTNTSQQYQTNPSHQYQTTSQQYQTNPPQQYTRNASSHHHNSAEESLKEPYPTTRRETERKYPEKSPKSKNYAVMEVKIPPMVRTGHPKQRRGPKKAVAFAADEKPGNPEDIDPVDTAPSGDT